MSAQKLKMLVLKHLAEKPRSGYGLIKDIEQATGWKPSYGSVYPLLEKLRQEGIVIFKENGKKKVYSLTAVGRAAKKESEKEHGQIIQKLRENHKLMLHLFDVKDDPLSETMFKSMEQGKIPLAEFIKESGEMKKELFRLYAEGKTSQKKKEIKGILKHTTAELRKL